MASILKAYELLVQWLVPPFVIFVVLSLCPASIKLNDQKAETLVPVSAPITDPVYGQLELVVSAPHKGLIDPGSKKRMPLSIALLGNASLAAAPAGSSGAASGPTYLIDVVATSANVEFTDSAGLPLSPQFLVQPTLDARDPVVVYMRPTGSGKPIELMVQVLGVDRLPIGGYSGLPVSVPVEAKGRAIGRYLLNQVFEASILAGLLAALVGFGIQQWNRLDQADKERHKAAQEQSDARRSQLEELERLLQDNRSDAARLYQAHRSPVQLSAGQDEDARFQAEWQTLWTHHAPEELQRVVELDRLSVEKKLSKAQLKADQHWTESIAALIWGYQNLDDAWKLRISDMLENDLENPLPPEEIGRRWRAILQPWLFLHPWSPPSFVETPALEEGIRQLHAEGRLRTLINPFSTAPGEQDVLLLDARTDLSLSRRILESTPLLIFGGAGTGKTAQALLAAYDCIQKELAFPVYYPLALETCTDRAAHVDGLAQAIVVTLLAYWIGVPNTFVALPPAVQARLAYLVGRYAGLGRGLVLRLQQMGYAPVGTGAIMQQTLRDLLEGITFEAEDGERDLIAALALARPAQVDLEHTAPARTFIFADWATRSPGPDSPAAVARLVPLLELLPDLARAGIYVKLFLPESLKPHLSQTMPEIERVTLEWAKDDLETVMRRRLNAASRAQFADLYDDDAAFSQPERRLIERVQQEGNTPAVLFRLGSALISRIASHPADSVITDEDLSAVLGDPEQSS